MADLYVLEGLGSMRQSVLKRVLSKAKPMAPAKRVTIRRSGLIRRVPGIVYGDALELLGKKSFFSKVGSVVKSGAKLAVAPVTSSYSVTKSAAKATVRVIKKPTIKNLTKVVTDPTTRAKGEVVKTTKEAAHGVAESARAGKIALDVTRRVAKRLIKKLAKKVLFKGDTLLGGSVAAIPKNAAKGVLIPVATAAVLANTVTAPASPVVPVLVNEVIDELYSKIESAIKKGLSPDKAAQEAKDALDKLEPGEEGDPKVGGMSFLPVAIGLAAIIGIVAVMKKKS